MRVMKLITFFISLISEVLIVTGFSASTAGPPLLHSPLGSTFEELGRALEGTGRAKLTWECYRLGVDPMNHPQFGQKATKRLLEVYHEYPTVDSLARVQLQTVAKDRTTKLLIKMADGLEVETVIIPWETHSTVCISSQVGCAQACSFCSTGRMGRLRSLSVDEILVQVIHAQRCVRETELPPVENIVFMGMGEPADNVDAVVHAVQTLTDDNLFALAPRKVTVSTVAPSLNSFAELDQAQGTLAWSLHSSRDEVRNVLVPTAKHSVEDLRDALIDVLREKSKKKRTIMLEMALLEGVNDSEEDARHLAQFCQPIFDNVQGIKLTVNLIPWNNIGASSGPASLFKTPSEERVLSFQRVLAKEGIRCYVRTTRGDDESAACGQLATKKP